MEAKQDANPTDVVTVYERCLVPCASYPGGFYVQLRDKEDGIGLLCVCYLHLMEIKQNGPENVLMCPPCTSAAWCPVRATLVGVVQTEGACKYQRNPS